MNQNKQQAQAPALAWTYTTRVKDLTDTDLEDELIVITPGPGSRNHWTLGRLLRQIRRDLERRGVCIQEGRDNEDLDVQTWLQWSDYRVSR